MNIGITCYPTYGGSGVLATELGKNLSFNGHKIHFISYSKPNRLDKFYPNIYFHEANPSTYPLFDFPLYSLALASKILEIYKYENLQIFHAHYAIPHSISAYLSKQILKKENKRINVITTLHGTDITLVGLEPAFKPLIKFSIEESCGVTAVSNFLKNETIKNYNVDKNIKVIYNFVNTNEFSPKKRNNSLRSQFASENEKIICHISNFRPVKRATDIIEIFSLVQKKIPSKLLLVGDGPDYSKCETLARSLNISDKVIFLGKQNSVSELLAISDLFLLTSSTESFGLSALEAMACGVPVVCTNIGGLPEVVKHKINGLLVNVGDILQFSSAVEEILTNTNLYKTMSQNSLDIVNENFRSDIITKQYEDFYMEIIDSQNDCN